MRPVFLCLAILLLGNPAKVSCQFEGVIGMKVAITSGDTADAVWYRLTVKNNLLLTEMTHPHDTAGGQQGAFIYRGDRHVLCIINPSEKSYTEITLHDETDSSSGDRSSAGGTAHSLLPTGLKSTILGYPCEEFIVREDGRESRIMATTAFGPVYGGLAKAFSSGSGGVGEADWSVELAARNYFPMTIVTTYRGKVEQSQEVFQVEPRKIPGSQFEPPEGYTRQVVDLDLGKIIQKFGTDSSAHR
jgi:hypothetical protein